MFGFCACELGTFFLPASLDNPSSFWHNTLVRWRASCSEKRQPDKAQTEMSVPCPAFFFFEEDDHGSAQGQCARGVVRGVLRFLDGAEPRLAEPLYPHLHAADGGDPRHGAGHRPTYAVSFLLLPLNIFSTYYFQAILKLGAAFFVSVARGLVISGALILLLPAVLGRLRSGGPCRSRSCWSRAMLCRPCGARRGRCRRAKTGPVCIHSCYRG